MKGEIINFTYGSQESFHRKRNILVKIPYVYIFLFVYRWPSLSIQVIKILTSFSFMSIHLSLNTHASSKFGMKVSQDTSFTIS